MEVVLKLAWVLLALVHLTPAMAFFVPSTLRRLYGIAPTGDVGVLLIHRGALFLAIVSACLYACFETSARRATSIVVAISVVGFLVTYVRSGAPTGLRPIAIADGVALAPLALAVFGAWRR